MGTDFFEDNNVRSENVAHTDRTEGVLTRPISDTNLTRMMRQKEAAMNQVASAAQELEQLRMRQEALEKEKNDLQELTRRQEEYEKGKREVVDKLIQSIVMLEKEETQAMRMVELASMVKSKFKDSLSELKAIDEEKWPEDSFQQELSKANSAVEEASATYRQALAKLDAARWQTPEQAPASSGVFSQVADGLGTSKSFTHWFLVGLAVSVPIMIFATILFGIYVHLNRLLQ